MGRNELLDCLATLLAGLQVTNSLDKPLLGTAAEPWQAIHDASGFGWQDAEQYRAFLEETLTDV